jgi:hypothetical protein
VCVACRDWRSYASATADDASNKLLSPHRHLPRRFVILNVFFFSSPFAVTAHVKTCDSRPDGSRHQTQEKTKIRLFAVYKKIIVSVWAVWAYRTKKKKRTDACFPTKKQYYIAYYAEAPF